MNEHFDESGRLSIELASLDSDDLFQCFANRIVKEFDATIINKLNGLDQKYWDFNISSTTIVLHSDTFMGISIYVENGSSETLLRKIVEKIKNK